MRKATLYLLVLLVLLAIPLTTAFFSHRTKPLEAKINLQGLEAELLESQSGLQIIKPKAELARKLSLKVKADSLNCYAYVLFQDGISQGLDILETDLDKNKWEEIKSPKLASSNKLYRYLEVVRTSEEDREIPVFSKLIFSDFKVYYLDRLGEDFAVKAYLHQADGLSQAEADAAALASLGGSNAP